MQENKEHSLSRCYSLLCPNNSECLTNGTAAVCKCFDGYIGSKCMYNPCSSNPCQNNATCVTHGSAFLCICTDEYTGIHCQDARISCPSKFCENGICKVNNDSQNNRCECFPGFTGSSCETNIDECASNPCKSQKCIDGINKYYCSCQNCQHGLCLYKNGKPFCWCFPGYYGSYCSINRDECLSQPCIHGTCSDASDGFECTCSRGYTGRLCDQYIKKGCHNNPCLHGTCFGYASRKSRCACPTGYFGEYCQHSTDWCMNKCLGICLISTRTSNTNSCIVKCKAMCVRYKEGISKTIHHEFIKYISTQKPYSITNISTSSHKTSTVQSTAGRNAVPNDTTTRLKITTPTTAQQTNLHGQVLNVEMLSKITKLSPTTLTTKNNTTGRNAIPNDTTVRIKLTTPTTVQSTALPGQVLNAEMLHKTTKFLPTTSTTEQEIYYLPDRMQRTTKRFEILSTTQISTTTSNLSEKLTSVERLLETLKYVTTAEYLTPKTSSPNECERNCLNGKCKQIKRNSFCECKDGFIGFYCNEICPCIHGYCQKNNGFYNCSCEHNYAGVLCDKILPNGTCDSTNCQHGYCHHGLCVCNRQYTGWNCDVYLNETTDICNTSPCHDVAGMYHL